MNLAHFQPKEEIQFFNWKQEKVFTLWDNKLAVWLGSAAMVIILSIDF